MAATNNYEKICKEWCTGCSCTVLTPNNPEECSLCTLGLLEAIKDLAKKEGFALGRHANHKRTREGYYKEHKDD